MEKEWGDMPECHKIKYILRGAHKNKTLNIPQHICRNFRYVFSPRLFFIELFHA